MTYGPKKKIDMSTLTTSLRHFQDFNTGWLTTQYRKVNLSLGLLLAGRKVLLLKVNPKKKNRERLVKPGI